MSASRRRRSGRFNQKYIVQDSVGVTDVQGITTLAEQDEHCVGTLERIVGNIHIAVPSHAVGGDFVYVDIAFYPEGDDMGLGPVNQGGFEDRHAKQILWKESYYFEDDDMVNLRIPIDIRGKRVMEEGDKIVIRYKNTNGNDNQRLTYSLSLFFLNDFEPVVA